MRRGISSPANRNSPAPRLPVSRSHGETKGRHGSFCDSGCGLAAQDLNGDGTLCLSRRRNGTTASGYCCDQRLHGADGLLGGPRAAPRARGGARTRSAPKSRARNRKNRDRRANTGTHLGATELANRNGPSGTAKRLAEQRHRKNSPTRRHAVELQRRHPTLLRDGQSAAARRSGAAPMCSTRRPRSLRWRSCSSRASALGSRSITSDDVRREARGQAAVP